MEKSKERLERPDPDYSFSESALNDFMNKPIWRTIEDLWKRQKAIATDLILQSRGEDDEFFKGMVNQLNYNLNLKEILMEDYEDAETKEHSAT